MAKRLLVSKVLRLLLIATLCAVGGFAGVAQGSASARLHPCTERVLVLSAMPVELAPLLAQTRVEKTVTVAGRDFYVGRLGATPVVLALTGIGPVNATNVTRAALSGLNCSNAGHFKAVVFSGVAGGDYIGDVIVPFRWTADAGRHFVAADRGLLATAARVARSRPSLEQQAPAGDPACGCVTSADAVKTVAVTHPPRIEIGGAGQTTDPFSGRALPCVPGGGDVFGCVPCLLQEQAARDLTKLATGATAFADPAFLAGYSAPAEDAKHYVAEDEETAAVGKVAAMHRVPFLGIRAVSDGGGDPLGLPGFPVQFFYYRQLAADNAARVTTAVLTSLQPAGARKP